MDEGGCLFIAGQNIAYFLEKKQVSREAEDFLEEYLHVEYVSKSTSKQVNGITNDAISDNLDFRIWQPFVSNDLQSPDIINPQNATTIFTYNGDEIAGIKYRGEHKLAFLAFGLESIDSNVNTTANDISPMRSRVLLRSLDWLNFLEHIPPENEAIANNKLPVLLKISHASFVVQSVMLHWRFQGAQDFKQVLMTNSGDRIYEGTIPVSQNGSAIEYYFQANTNYYSFTSPIGAPSSFHSIGLGTRTTVENTINAQKYKLKQNYPNPFNPNTAIAFELPKKSLVKINIYNARGQKIKNLFNSEKPAGRHRIVWAGQDEAGKPVAAGIYFLQLLTEEFSQSRRMLLIR